MAENDGPKSPDPGRNAGSRVRWGTQILAAFATLQSSVAELGRTAKTSSEELVGLGKKVEVLDGIRKDFDGFKTASTIETNYLKAWSRWALGTAIALILGLGAAAASVLSNQNAMLANDANMTKVLDKASEADHREMDKFDKIVVDLNKTVGDLNKTVGDLNKTVGSLSTKVEDLNANVGSMTKKVEDLNTNVGGMNEALKDFRRSLDEFNKKSDTNIAKLEKVDATVEALKNSIEKTKGDSFSEFTTQRTLITSNDLKDRKDKTSPLLFEIELPYETLSPARSARPSATLATPHPPIFDTFSYQIKVKRIDNKVLSISIASNEASLDAIEKFLKTENGKIPLELTIRTPIPDK